MSLFIWYTVFLLFNLLEFSTPDLINLESNEQSGSLSDAVQKNVDEEHATFDEKKTSKEDNSVHNRGQLAFNERKRDEKRYDEKNTVRKGHDKGSHSLGETDVVDHERNSFERHGRRYYKKGHHRTGFNNNYHKDESGNNSSFYEDSDDEGGHKSSGNSGGYYGLKSQDSFRDGSRDAFFTERDRAEKGMYDNRQNVNNDYDRIGGYRNDRYKDNRENYLRNEARRYFDKNGKRVYHNKERYHPVVYRNNDYVPSIGYSRYYLDILPRDYYRRERYIIPYSKSYRYFPYWQWHYEREPYYLYRGHYDRDYRDDFRDNEYLNKYRNGF
ncbi:unnamed protein product [Xylocopa violacea]|uniref:Uncharacterized protein n=1 Tax=Xylocopa violacea TaxID=135666 RepID=A0ABP1N7L1_XYLVO